MLLVGSVLLQDEAANAGDGGGQMSTAPVVINMDGADQRLSDRQQQQLHLVDEQVTTSPTYIHYSAVLIGVGLKCRIVVLKCLIV